MTTDIKSNLMFAYDVKIKIEYHVMFLSKIQNNLRE